jgi:F-type H+-transporting ATPase subunit c
MRKLQYLLMTLSVLFCAVPAFAQSGTGVVDLAPIGIGIGLALAAGLCGLGQGKATASAVEALARNPGARAWHLQLSDARSGVHRVADTVHAGHHLPEDQVTIVFSLV